MVIPLLVKACWDIGLCCWLSRGTLGTSSIKGLIEILALHLQHSKSLTHHLSITASSASIMCLNPHPECQTSCSRPVEAARSKCVCIAAACVNLHMVAIRAFAGLFMLLYYCVPCRSCSTCTSICVQLPRLSPDAYTRTIEVRPAELPK